MLGKWGFLRNPPPTGLATNVHAQKTLASRYTKHGKTTQIELVTKTHRQEGPCEPQYHAHTYTLTVFQKFAFGFIWSTFFL